METLPNKPENGTEATGNLAVLMDVDLPVSIRFGETEMTLDEIMRLGVGSVIELNTGIDEPVELVVNGLNMARGEVISVDGFYGIRITEVTSVNERIRSFNK